MGEPVVFAVADSPHLFLFWCEGCGYMHHIDTQRWSFNGDMHSPTVTPSLLVTAAAFIGSPRCHSYAAAFIGSPRCHSYVTAGQIRYLSDSTHALAGQTVDMIPPPP